MLSQVGATGEIRPEGGREVIHLQGGAGCSLGKEETATCEAGGNSAGDSGRGLDQVAVVKVTRNGQLLDI